MFLEIFRNSQKNTKKRKKTPAQMPSCEFCKIHKNSFSYRIPPVAASVHVIPYPLSILSHLSRPLTGYLPLNFPIENIIENKYSKLTSTWYIHCFKSCYSNFLQKSYPLDGYFWRNLFSNMKAQVMLSICYIDFLVISKQNFIQEYFLFIFRVFI